MAAYLLLEFHKFPRYGTFTRVEGWDEVQKAIRDDVAGVRNFTVVLRAEGGGSFTFIPVVALRAFLNGGGIVPTDTIPEPA